jgi:hypothetical protein
MSQILPFIQGAGALYGATQSFRGGGQPQQTTQVGVDPATQARYQDIYQRALGLSQQPFTPYTGPQVAGFSPDELRAFEAQRQQFGRAQAFDPFAQRQQLMQAPTPQIAQVGGRAAQISTVPQPVSAEIGPVAQPGFAQIGQVGGPSAAQIERITGPQAAQISAPRQLQVPSLLQADIGAYRSPFEQQVVDVALGDIQRQQDIAQQRAQEQAIRAGAFGGSRGAILEAEAARPFAEQAARTAAELRQAGFEQAQRAAESDIQRQLAAQQFGIGLEADIATQQAQLQQQAGLTGFEAERQRALQQAQLAQQAGLTGTELQQQRALQQAQLQQQAGLLGAEQAQQRALQQAQLQQQAGMLGAEQAQQRALEQARLQQQFGLAGMDIGARRALEQARMQQQQQQFRAGLIEEQERAQQQALQGLLGTGGQQRALQQQALGAARGEFERALQYPYQQFGLLSQAVSGVPAMQGQVSRGSAGSADILGGLGSLLGSLAIGGVFR